MNDELLDQFLVEGREQAAQAERALMQVQRHPEDRPALETAFRAVHTLKGSTGLFDLQPMGRLLHSAEDLLDELRRRSGGEDDFTFLLAAIDQTGRWLGELEQQGRLADDAGQIASQLLEGRSATAPSPASTPRSFIGRVGVSARYIPRSDAYFVGDDPVALVAQAPGLIELKLGPRQAWPDLEAYDPFVCNLVIDALFDATREEIEHVFRLVADQVTITETSALAVGPADAEPGLRTLRVESERLDELASLTDELMIAKAGDADLAATAAALPGGEALARALRLRQVEQDRLAGALYTTVARLRLAPLGPLFERFPRLMRDLSRDLGKAFDFEILCGDVVLDKALIDGLFEPLLHVLRNAADHGIEASESRIASGKRAKGHLILRAETIGDRVMIEVSDDGAGLNSERLRHAAVERGLLSLAQAQGLTEAAAYDLIFLPGISTRREASQVSGRGVGMDAVRASVSKLGGNVRLQSHPNEGTTVCIDLPLTLKLSKLLVLECGGERYGLDLATVLELTLVRPEDITAVRAGFGFVWRDQPVPLLRLSARLGLSDDAPDSGGRVVVVETDQGPLGLLVDGQIDRMEAIVRPPNGILVSAASVGGVTRLANGDVLLVLNPKELAE